ncbi:MAG: GTPase, partial [Acidimicrobiales bacterium]
DPAARLGLPRDAPAAGVAAAAAAALERWRTWVNTGRAPFAARGAAGVVIRSLERLCAEAG